MSHDPAKTLIYHITDVENLPGILADGGLHSDAVMAARKPTVIGYSHIKTRRLKENRIACCGNRFVGEFVPFYFCPRSPMLYTVNIGATGLKKGCQRTILHLVSSVAAGVGLGQPWAISKINAGVGYADASSFSSEVTALDELDWNAIRATYWPEVVSRKAAEFLVADFFPWKSIEMIGCHNETVANRVQDLLKQHSHNPAVVVRPVWYYPEP